MLEYDQLPVVREAGGCLSNQFLTLIQLDVVQHIGEYEHVIVMGEVLQVRAKRSLAEQVPVDAGQAVLGNIKTVDLYPR
jgi:hypothetical protein